jgi:DNA polymerase III subunit alpha
MWVPLRVHSQYSILDATAPVKDLVKYSKKMGMSACALTDHGNLFGAIEFYKACVKEGVKPLLGCELYVAEESRFDRNKGMSGYSSFHLTVIAKNETGYKNLCKLTSAGYLEGFYYNPRVDDALLAELCEGLICITGSLGSLIAHEVLQGTEVSLNERVLFYKKLFKEDFYLEIQRHVMDKEEIRAHGMQKETWLYKAYQDHVEKQEKVNQRLIVLAKELAIDVVVTTDSHYLEKEDYKAHEVLLNVQSGEPCELWEHDQEGRRTFSIPNPKRRTYPSHAYYFKSQEEIFELFKDVKEAVTNTVKVADKCTLKIDFDTKHYPVFIAKHLEGTNYTEQERRIAAEEYLKKLCEEGINKRYTKERLEKVLEIYPNEDPSEVVKARLKRELSIIIPKGMCDYLLIVWDFIHWAKSHEIPVGPGRGSGAGSIILYLIGVTDIEPLRFHLFFERFINPDRLSYPDIDVDICMDRRGEVIQYTMEKYGANCVCQIITFGTMKPKMAIRDVGRALNIPLAKVDSIAKLVPEDPNMSFLKALEDPDLKRVSQEDEDGKKIIELGLKLEGSIRNLGIHAAGVIISGRPLQEIIPICKTKDAEMAVTQYSMKPLEEVGMLKMDLLGLTTLTSITLCVKAIEKNYHVKIAWDDLPLEDEKTFSLLNQGNTMGVFQLESAGMQELARKLHLDSFEELIAVVSLYRPGPMDMIPSFIDRKHKREPIEYDHPWMEEILSETYGIMVYQEQVMQIAERLANYSLGEGDVLRRAMGKKQMEEMAQQREKFRIGAMKNGISEQVALKVFDQMEKFAAYGFNKSHAAAYGYLSYVTAFLKANYPKEWMAALMTTCSHDLTKVAKFIREAKSMSIAILPPAINSSTTSFVATQEGIRFALSAIKGVGTHIVEEIVKTREKVGLFEDLYDFFLKVDSKKLGKKIVELLIKAGSFDTTNWSREALLLSVESMHASALKDQKNKSLGVRTLFDLMGESGKERFKDPPKVINPLTAAEKLFLEKELLGFFLTGHPMEIHQKLLKSLHTTPLKNMDTMQTGALFKTAFLLESVHVRTSQKTQKKFAIIQISDGYENYEVPIWSDLFATKGHLLLENKLLLAILQVEHEEGRMKLNAFWMEDLARMDQEKMTECYKAYDEAKLKIQRRGQKMTYVKKQTEKAVITTIDRVNLIINTDTLHLSEVLSLKKCLLSHPGKCPITLSFMQKNAPIARMEPAARFFVDLSEAFKKEIENFTSIKLPSR